MVVGNIDCEHYFVLVSLGKLLKTSILTVKCHNFAAYSRFLLPFKDNRPEKEEIVHAVYSN